MEDGSITLTFLSDLDPKIYDIPLTFKTYVPENWESVQVMSEGQEIVSVLEVGKDDLGQFIRYNLIPGAKEIVISAIP